tara:strand:- start:1002 stop:2639 length:1638 start_codon:yes stop_codon:yes gene_type:complete
MISPTVTPTLRNTLFTTIPSAGGFSGLLDQYGGAAAAYAPLALTKDHVSDLPTIYAQRDSDEALLAFTQQGIINGDLETWAGAGNAYVYTYYDQSGTGNDLTQATRAAQHKIVDTGVLIKLQDSVACVSTGTSYYDFDSAVTLTGEFSISSVVEYGVGGNGVILGSTSSNNPRLRAIKTAAQWEILNGTGEVNLTIGYSNKRERIHHIRNSSNSNAGYLKTTSVGSATLSGTFSFTRAFARNSGIDSIDGKIQALIIYPSDQTANLTGIDAALDKMLAKPKEIFVMIGQSNMVGRAVDGTTLTTRANDGNLLEYRNLGGTNEFTGRYLDYYPSGVVTGFGPNVGMARTLYAGGDRNINIVRFATGGTSVASFLEESRRLLDPQTDLPPSDTDQWATMVAYTNTAIAAIQADSCTSCTIKFVWYQGAEDSNYTGTQGGYLQDLAGMYETHLTRLIEDLRSNITIATTVTPWVIIRSPDWNGNGQGGGVKAGQAEVRAAQVAVADADSNAQWLTSDINQSVTATWEDASHIDAASQERLGIDLAAIV